MNVESQKTVTVSDPSRGITAPMFPPPEYMPPPYHTGPVMYPQPIPVRVSFIPPNLPPEQASIS